MLVNTLHMYMYTYIHVHTHVLHTCTLGVDYKRLMSAEEDPLLILTPSLLSTNVHVIAKIANKIPCEVCVCAQVCVFW